MSPIQIILIIIIALILLKTFQKYHARQITDREFWLWAAFWALIAVLVIFPNATQSVANLVGIGRGVDLIVYLALVALFFGLFYIIVRLERLERDLTKIVREKAIEKNSKSKI